jgi:hypothetical protein
VQHQPSPHSGAHDDLQLLNAWANGKAGAGVRLARRAWLVLEALDKRDPYLLGAAGPGTSRVHALFSRYRQLGALGLLDEVRSGRPQTSSALLNDVLSYAKRVHPTVAAAAIRSLPKSMRERIWRSNKRAGSSLERDRSMRVSRVTGPAGFPELMGVLSLPGMMVLVTTTCVNALRFSGSGTWLAVDRLEHLSKTAGASSLPLIEAIRVTSASAADSKRSAPSTSRLVHEVFPAFHSWGDETLLECGGAARIDVCVSEADGNHAMHHLPHLRNGPLMNWFTKSSMVKRYEPAPLLVMRAYRSRLAMLNATLQEIGVTPHPSHEVTLQALASDTYFCWRRVKVFDADEEE